MPIYEYECLSCGERFEEMRKLSDPAVTQCRLCKGTVRKLIAAPALQFKGSGWYITDYAGKNASSQKDAGPKEGGNGSGAPKTETTAQPAPDKKEAPSCACHSGKCGAPAK